jgi:divalent metal cation (Fe/Co/Zn/Cd) transporter
MALYRVEHPTIGMTTLFGYRIWSGWIMIAALTFSAIPPVILGRMKLKLARELHNKTLHADADMNKADWTTAVAAIIGILGVGLGYWWADAVAAGLIALDITRDGLSNMWPATTDLLNERPTTVDGTQRDPLPYQLQEALEEVPWVKDVGIRLRDEGMLVSGEVFVVPNIARDDSLTEKVTELKDRAINFHWRIYDIVVMPVEELEDPVLMSDLS